MVSSTVILKLGGSVITDKRSRKPKFRARTVLQLMRELFLVLRANPTLRIILLHGAGSFGHPLAYRYKLTDAPLNRRTLEGFKRTTTSIRQLGNLIANVCWSEGLPVIPLQTSTCFSVQRQRLVLETPRIVSTFLNHRAIPLFGGDVVLTDQRRVTVASADDLAVSLARAYKVRSLWFATDVDGVLDSHGNLKKTLSRSDVHRLVRGFSAVRDEHDVTGGMIGKLESLLKLRHRRITIFNGMKNGQLLRIAQRGRAGTRLSV